MIAMPAIDPVFAHAAAAGLGAVLLLGAIEKLRQSFQTQSCYYQRGRK